MKFKEYNFKSYIQDALKRLSFDKPTLVQERVIPEALKGNNLVVESATGSGKTHAFLLPIFQNLDENNKNVQAVILSPTRELAAQLFNVAKEIVEGTEVDVRLFIGGQNRETEIKRLSTSQPQVVIGTLGRISDLAIKANVLKIYQANTLVVDEADMVFDEKDLVEVDKVISLIQDEPQFLVFSATMPKSLRIFVNKYLSGVDEIIIEEKSLTKEAIEHVMIPCKARAKEDVLLELLETITPYMAIIFANTKEKVDHLSSFLASNNYKVAKIHGDLDERERKQILKRIHDLKYQYIVASDIAARGIDIEGISDVINFDLPKDTEFYIHRSGRTARYEATGRVFSLYTYDTENYVDELKKKGLNPIFMKIVDHELVQTKLPKSRNVSVVQEAEAALHQRYKLPKKVKPGYKKKRMEKINKELRKVKRGRIEEIYRRKNKGQN
jgi:ATP-dependent RNA helicase CshB